jgi:hypothetical protein
METKPDMVVNVVRGSRLSRIVMSVENLKGEEVRREKICRSEEKRREETPKSRERVRGRRVENCHVRGELEGVRRARGRRRREKGEE